MFLKQYITFFNLGLEYSGLYDIDYVIFVET